MTKSSKEDRYEVNLTTFLERKLKKKRRKEYEYDNSTECGSVGKRGIVVFGTSVKDLECHGNVSNERSTEDIMREYTSRKL